MAENKTSIWVWFSLIMLVLMFIALIVFLDQTIAVKRDLDQQNQTATDNRTKPVIDFYKVLPERESIDIPLSESDQQAIDNPILNNAGKSAKTILQAGSFKSSEEADRHKARLAFFGLEAKIFSANVNNQTWYRVQLGPFKTQHKLSQAKNRLIENDIQYIEKADP